jgi:CHRD domain
MMPGVAALAVLVLGQAAAQSVEINARLATVPIDARTEAAITGGGEVGARLDGQRLRIDGSFSGLQGAASAAQLHRGSARGVRGPAIHDLEVTPATQGSLQASIELSTADVDALRAGRLYVQIDSESAPDGNLWAWLIP